MIMHLRLGLVFIIIRFVGELELKICQCVSFVVGRKVENKIKANNVRSIQTLMFGLGAKQ